jgi:uncharacterized membrane protein
MSDRKVRVWFALFVLAIFCVGLAGGALVARRLLPMERPIDRLMRDPRAGEPGDPDGRRGRLDTLRDVRDRFDAERRTVRDEIRNVLTPEQQQKFDAMEKDGRGRPGRRMR